MFETKGLPVSLSIYTKFVVIVPCSVGVMRGGMKGGVRLAMARENTLLSCAFADPVVLKFLLMANW